ncbi:MAG: VTT domain-containing protein [Candidatus Moraniibacteriota bacterium]|nr:MAG: VTT domain-containing protein [Candidatus Moranbacteria bacterium]
MLPGVNLSEFILTIGYIGLFAVIFAETGLFLGFFLPGDSLLFVAGLLASGGVLSLPALLMIVFTAAVLGNVTGYIFGLRVGTSLFSREESVLFKKSHVRRAEEFFNRYGAKTIVLARFMPIVRTFAPILAGVGRMNFREFFFYNVIGGFLWSFGLLLGGFFLGQVVPDVDRYILPIVVIIIILSFLPGILKYRQEKRRMMQDRMNGNNPDTDALV